MQNKIKMNGVEIWQPDEGLEYSFETTYTSDSTRVQTGVGYFTPMFTVEQLGYTATHVPQKEVTKILQIIDKGYKFNLHYFSLHYGRWKDGIFYVGKGNLSIKSLKENNEYVQTLAFNMTGNDPI